MLAAWTPLTRNLRVRISLICEGVTPSIPNSSRASFSTASDFSTKNPLDFLLEMIAEMRVLCKKAENQDFWEELDERELKILRQWNGCFPDDSTSMLIRRFYGGGAVPEYLANRLPIKLPRSRWV